MGHPVLICHNFREEYIEANLSNWHISVPIIPDFLYQVEHNSGGTATTENPLNRTTLPPGKASISNVRVRYPGGPAFLLPPNQECRSTLFCHFQYKGQHRPPGLGISSTCWELSSFQTRILLLKSSFFRNLVQFEKELSQLWVRGNNLIV